MSVQFSDRLIFNGVKTFLSIRSVSQIMLPEFHPDMIIRGKQPGRISSASLQRGFSATWELKNNRLYLISVNPWNLDITLKKSPIFASWLTGQFEITPVDKYLLEANITHCCYFENGTLKVMKKVSSEEFQDPYCMVNKTFIKCIDMDMFKDF